MTEAAGTTRKRPTKTKKGVTPAMDSR